MTSRAILTVVLLVSETLGAARKGGVSFSMNTVELSCPEDGEWSKVNGKNVESLGTGMGTYNYTYSGSKDHYYCEYQDQIYRFYIQGKVCENVCLEFDGLVLVGVIVGDVIGTALVMLIVYKCTKKKKKAAASPRAAKPAGRREDIPMNSDYAPLSVHTRSQDYSVINRTG